MNRSVWIGLLASLVGMALVAPAAAQQQKPNILVIMADDIGYWNISAYNRRGSLRGSQPRWSWSALCHKRTSRPHPMS